MHRSSRSRNCCSLRNYSALKSFHNFLVFLIKNTHFFHSQDVFEFTFDPEIFQWKWRGGGLSDSSRDPVDHQFIEDIGNGNHDEDYRYERYLEIFDAV